MAALTLHQGDAQATFVEHPTEIARKALMAAALVEAPRLADQLRCVAEALPDRAPFRLHRADTIEGDV